MHQRFFCSRNQPQINTEITTFFVWLENYQHSVENSLWLQVCLRHTQSFQFRKEITGGAQARPQNTISFVLLYPSSVSKLYKKACLVHFSKRTPVRFLFFESYSKHHSECSVKKLEKVPEELVVKAPQKGLFSELVKQQHSSCNFPRRITKSWTKILTLTTVGAKSMQLSEAATNWKLASCLDFLSHYHHLIQGILREFSTSKLRIFIAAHFVQQQ